MARIGSVLLVAAGAGQLVETLRGGDAVVMAEGSAAIQQLKNPPSDPTVAVAE